MASGILCIKISLSQDERVRHPTSTAIAIANLQRAILTFWHTREPHHLKTAQEILQRLCETETSNTDSGFSELTCSNSMIEAWWRSLKHQWLLLHALDSIATVHRLVAFYVDAHNRGLPHSAFRGQTPDEMYFGTGRALPTDLASRAAAVRRRTRLEANRSASCVTCWAIATAV